MLARREGASRVWPVPYRVVQDFEIARLLGHLPATLHVGVEQVVVHIVTPLQRRGRQGCRNGCYKSDMSFPVSSIDQEDGPKDEGRAAKSYEERWWRVGIGSEVLRGKMQAIRRLSGRNSELWSLRRELGPLMWAGGGASPRTARGRGEGPNVKPDRSGDHLLSLAPLRRALPRPCTLESAAKIAHRLSIHHPHWSCSCRMAPGDPRPRSPLLRGCTCEAELFKSPCFVRRSGSPTRTDFEPRTRGISCVVVVVVFV